MTDSRRRRRCASRTPRSRGEGGWVLSSVIGVMLFLTIVAVAILAYVFSGLRLTKAAIDSADRVRAIDSAMETGLQSVRGDAGTCATLNKSVQGYEVTCVNDSGSPVDTGATEVRKLKLIAETSSGALAGQAKVRIVDLVVNEADIVLGTPRQLSMGYTIEICDWQLGGSAAAKPLKDCS